RGKGGRNRGQGQWPDRDPERSLPRRARRRAGQFPDRSRKQFAGGPEGPRHAAKGFRDNAAGTRAMIARLIAWSARNAFLVLLATLLSVAAGLYALRTIPLDAIPDLSDTQV